MLDSNNRDGEGDNGDGGDSNVAEAVVPVVVETDAVFW